MKSKMLTGLVIMMLTPSVYADFSISWGATEGFWKNGDPGTGFLDVTVNSSQTALVQLIFTPDMAASPATLGNTDFTTGGEMVLADYVLTIPTDDSGFFYGDNWTENFTGPFSAGWVYARVFEYDNPSITVGTLYYDSPLIAPNDITSPTAPPDTLAMNLTPTILDGDELVLTVAIPEPGTVVSIVFGFALLIARRKMRK